MTTIVYPNARNCAEMMIHVWQYYRGLEGKPSVYRCERCAFVITKTDLKAATDTIAIPGVTSA